MAEEERQPVSPVAYLPTEILDKIIDPSEIIERACHDFKGEAGPFARPKKDKDGKVILDTDGKPVIDTYWIQVGKPFMNDFGINEMRVQLTDYINRVSIFSQQDEEQINKKMLIMDFDLIDLFASKYVEYEIDINRMSIMKDRILDMCHLAIMSSHNKALMDALTKLFSVSEMKDTTKKGFSLSDLSPLKLIKRGEQTA